MEGFSADDAHMYQQPGPTRPHVTVFVNVEGREESLSGTDQYVAAPDLFGSQFQARVFARPQQSYEEDQGNEDDTHLDEMDFEYPDPEALPSIEFPDYPSPFSGSGEGVTSPDSIDDGDSGEDNDDVDDVESPAPGQVANGQAPPKRRRGRPRIRTGQRGGWNKGKGGGPRAPLDPSSEFTALYQQAMRAYNFEGDLDKAHEIIVEAISMNPEVFNAHILLADIWFARGESSNAVQALWAGAHCYPRDPYVWHMVIEACLERATYARQIALNQARYALKALLKINSADCDALFQLATVEQEAGRPKKALDMLDKIMLEMPYNTDALKLYSEICVDMQKLEVAIDRYKEAILHYRTNGMQEGDAFEWADVSQYVKLLSLRDGDRQVILQNSINVLKKLSRWLLGRASETFWDLQEDNDAEYDLDILPRRIVVPGYRHGRFPQEQYGQGLPMQLRVQLGSLRLKQGNAREEALNHFAWLSPDDPGEQSSLQQLQDDLLSVATALNEAMEHREASRFFEALLRVDSEKDISFWIGIGTSMYICDEKDRALEHFQSALALDDDSIVAKTYVCKIFAEQGKKLPAIKYGCEAVEAAHAAIPPSLEGVRKYERLDGRAEREAAEAALRLALKLPGPAPPKKRQGRLLDDGSRLNGLELIKPRAPLPAKPGKKAPKRPPRPPTPAEDKPQKVDDLRSIYNTMITNEEAMQAGDSIAIRIWMNCAKTMINDFRSNDVFYPKEKHMQFQGYDAESIRASRRPLYEKQTSASNTPQPDTPSDSPTPQPPTTTIPTTYRDIPFPTWLDIFLTYALLASRSLEPNARRDTYLVLQSATLCVIWYHSPASMYLINCVHLTCALNLRDQITLFGTVIPWFFSHAPLSTSPFQLFEILHELFPWPNDPAGKLGQMENAYMSKSTKTSRILFRHINAVDHWLVDDYIDPETGEAVPEFMRKARDDIMTFYSSATTTTTTSDGPDGEDPRQQPLRTQEMNPAALTLYGQLLFAKGQFLSALPWFHRARALLPNHPLIALLLALCYIQQPLKAGFRALGEKHGWILQGVASLEEYGRLRVREGGVQDEQRKRGREREVRFNKARCRAMLGMAGLGVEGWEGLVEGRVVDRRRGREGDEMEIDGGGDGEEKERSEMDEIDYLSAYALRTTYALSGNVELARRVTERYLVVE